MKHAPRPRRGTWLLLLLVASFSLSTARGIEISGYDPEVNNRFSSGFGTLDPVENQTDEFVGSGYDWSGIGWNQSPGGLGRVQNFAMLSPVDAFSSWHYSLTEQYAWDSNRIYAQFVNRSGEVVSATLSVVGRQPEVPGFTTAQDLRITKLTRPFTVADEVSYLRVLDISSGNYFQQPAFLMGSNMEGTTDFSTGPLVATGRINWRYLGQVAVSGHTTDAALSYLSSSGGDSGSPLLIPYKGELTIVGATWTATGAANSLLHLAGNSYDPVPGVNAIMAENGYALKWTIYDVPTDTGNTANRWNGGAGSGEFAEAANWSLGFVPDNRPAIFDAVTANGQTRVELGGNSTLRGILFAAGGGTEGFTLTSSGTLTIGASGIRNESAGTQTFNQSISLASSQNWEAVAGGLHFDGNIANNGFLVVIGGSGDVTFSGNFSGSGGLAKDDAGTLTLAASSSFTGKTFIHNGTLRLGTDNALFARSPVIFDTANADATFDINSRSVTIGSLRSEVSAGATGVVSITGGLLNVGGSHASTTYAGVFLGNGSITKIGIGTWTLTGVSDDFGGSLFVQRGGVTLNGVLGGGGKTVAVSLGNGTSLRGNGTIVGRLHIGTGSELMLSDSAFSVFSITEGIVWDGGGIIKMELGGDGRTDIIDLMTGLLQKGEDGSHVFDFSVTENLAPGTEFVLMKFGSTNFSAEQFSYTGLEGLEGHFSIVERTLIFSVVPEPSVLPLCCVAMGLFSFVLLGRRRPRFEVLPIFVTRGFWISGLGCTLLIGCP